MAYIPGAQQFYFKPMGPATTAALATPLIFANRLTVRGQPGTDEDDKRTDDIVSPWLTVKPLLQNYAVLNPQFSQSTIDLPNTTA